MSVSLEMINDPHAWDMLVEASAHGVLFHRWEFLGIMARHTGYRLLPYGIYKDRELACVFPLFFKARNGLRMINSPPPGLSVPYLGPVMAPLYDRMRQDEQEAFMGDMLGAVEAELAKLSPHYMSIQTVPLFGDIRPFLWRGYDAEVNYDYVTDLDRPLEAIRASLDKDVKNIVKDLGDATIETVQSYDTNAFFTLLSERIGKKKQAFYRHNIEFYEDVLKAYPDNLKLHFYYYKGEFVSAKIASMYKDKYIAWKGFAVGEFNEYMTWDRMKWAKLNGYKVFENPDADTRRLAQYKSKFNPSLEVRYTLSRRGAVGMVAEWAYVNVYATSLRKVQGLKALSNIFNL